VGVEAGAASGGGPTVDDGDGAAAAGTTERGEKAAVTVEEERLPRLVLRVEERVSWAPFLVEEKWVPRAPPSRVAV
jgi:hypothetical protein